MGVRHLQCHGASDQSELSWNRKLSIFDTFWPRVAIFVFDPQQWRISWYCLNTLSDQNSPFRRPKRPDILNLTLWGHRSSQRRLSRQEAERRRDHLKQGRNHRGLAWAGLGWAGPGDRNHLIMPSWRSLATLVMQTISQDRIIKYTKQSQEIPHLLVRSGKYLYC